VVKVFVLDVGQSDMAVDETSMAYCLQMIECVYSSSHFK